MRYPLFFCCFSVILLFVGVAHGRLFQEAAVLAEVMQEEAVPAHVKAVLRQPVNNTCVATQCLAEGETCSVGGSIQNNDTVFQVCNFDTFCDPDTSQCTPTFGLGEPCIGNGTNILSGSECGLVDKKYPFRVLNCVNDTCELQFPSAAIGDRCNTTDDCTQFGNNTITCTDSICTGLSEGQACTNSMECNFGLYCKASTCQAQLGVGESCQADSLGLVSEQPCLPNLVCGLPENTTDPNAALVCVPLFQKSEGDRCVDTLECALGNSCSNGTCIAAEETPCSAATDCSSGFCSCNLLGSQVCKPLTPPAPFAAGCESVVEALLNCTTQNSCSNSLNENENSCSFINCPNEVECAVDCVRRGALREVIEAGCLILDPTLCNQGNTTTTA